MVYVAELARLAGRLDDETAARHASGAGARWGCRRRGPGAPFDDLLAVMRVDKKARGATLRFVVLDGLARPAVLADPSDELLRAAYADGARHDRGRWSSTDPTWAGSAAASPRSTAPPPTASWPRCARSGAGGLGLEVEVRQTNHEGEMLDWLNEAADEAIPVVLNAAAWTHYSYALFDACAQLTAPLVEVHISDPHAAAGGVPAHLRRHAVRRWRSSPATASTATGWRWSGSPGACRGPPAEDCPLSSDCPARSATPTRTR